MPAAQKRLGELNSLMAADNFWNNREKAQKLIDEANSLRNKIEPLLKAEKHLEDFRVMLELGEAEPPKRQPKVQQELERDLAKFFKDLDALELKVFLSGPHDRKNCIFSINAGAGGTEALRLGGTCCSRMYQRWAESRGWEVEVTDALPGEGAGIKSVDDAACRAKTPTALPRPNAASTGWCASRRSIPTSAATPVLPAWT